MTGVANGAAPGSRDIFRLAWPMTLKAIFLHGTVVIDGWMVSSLGEVALAAMGIAAALGGIVLGAIFAFSHAMQIRTAQLYGGRDPVHLKSVLASGLILSMGIGLLGIAILLIFGGTFINLLAENEAVAGGAWSYLSIFTIVLAGEAIGQCVASYLNGCGRTKIPLIGYCISVPINVIASYGLIHGLWGLPAMGVAGAALGSAFGITTQTSFLASQLLRQDSYLRRISGWQKGTLGRTLARHVQFSLPIAATFISATLATHICTLIYANMALPAFAAMTLIAPWNMVAGQISMQWTQASGILVAQLLGNRTPEAMLSAFLSIVWRGAFIAAGIVALVFLIMGLTLNQIYPDLSDETRAILLTFIPLMILVQPFRATNAVCGNTLRASGDTIYVMHIFVWSQWAFRVPLTALFVLYFDLPAVLILSLIFWEEIVKFLPFHRRLWRGAWQHANVLD
ncbi:MAG: MATE family efflux transporter [Litoreibacter sp.]|nr:MATE family efflux transporter [Litoreibacter sp.]MCY4333685.1 MATE family efflux transporter [Litoreibacter sp.]